MNIERIKSVLDKEPGLDGWFLRRSDTESTTIIRLPAIVAPKFDARHSTFEISPNPEPREVILAPTEDLWLVVYARTRKDGKDVMGEAIGQLTSDEPDAVRAALGPLIAAAQSQSNLPYSLPPGDSVYPSVKLADPELENAGHAELVARCQRFNDAVIGAAGQDEAAQVSNLELFIHRSRAHAETSTGAVLDYPATRVNAEVCFVSRPARDRIGEYTARLSARRLADLEPEKVAALCAENARGIALAGPPPDFAGPVVLSGEAAADAFLGNPLFFHANARFVYEKSVRYERGKPVTADAEVKAERLNLDSDPLIEYGVGSERLSSHDAAPATRVSLVKDGCYEGLRGLRRYVEYLGLLNQGLGPAFHANVVVAPGRHSAEELKSGDAVVVHAFSDWEADMASGDFACEIRLAELRKSGKVTPFKGGLLVGNFFAALADASYSRETIRHGRYYGPEAVRFGNLKVAG